MDNKDIEALIKLQGTVEGPRNDDEYIEYYNERVARITKLREAVWLLLNHDPEIDGKTWAYYTPDRTDEVMQISTTEYPDFFEASKGSGGEIGSGLVSLSTAVEFIENT